MHSRMQAHTPVTKSAMGILLLSDMSNTPIPLVLKLPSNDPKVSESDNSATLTPAMFAGFCHNSG